MKQVSYYSLYEKWRIIHNNLLCIKMRDYIISTKNIFIFIETNHHFILIFLQNKFCNRADIHKRLASFKIYYILFK